MRKQWWFGGVAVAVLAGGAGVAVWASKGDAPKKSEKAVPVLEFVAGEVTQPALVTMPGRIEFSGPLVAPGTVIVHSKASGTLVTLNVAEGSRVKAGESLGQLDLEELRARMAERTAAVEAAKAQVDLSERQFKANEGLAAQNFIASTALDTSRAGLEAARGTQRQAQAQLDVAQVTLRQAALVAPISGVVAKRWALPGEKLAPEQQVLTIVDLSKLELAGLVGTQDISRLKPGMPVSVKVEGNDKPVEARIARIAPAAEPGTRSIGVTVTLDNPGELFRAGQYAVAQVDLPDNTERLTVPETAISSNSGQEQVWMLRDGVLVRRIIITGRHDAHDGRVEVLKGLDATSQVLATRFDNLSEGQKAAVVMAKSGATSAPKVADALAPSATAQN